LVNGKKKGTDPGYVDEKTWFYKQLEAGDTQLDLNGKEAIDLEKSTEKERKAQTDAALLGSDPAATPEQKAALEAANADLRRAEGKVRAKYARQDPRIRHHAGGTNTVERERQLAGTEAETEQRPAGMD